MASEWPKIYREFMLFTMRYHYVNKGGCYDFITKAFI